jgi:acyl-CoA thioester hydrolase
MKALFTHTLRVRWSEVDLQKVVFNGNYLNYFDVAFTEYMRDSGLPSALEQNAAGFEMFAKKATVEYSAPAHFDDELNITVQPVKLGNTSVVFALEVWRGAVGLGDHIVSGELVYVHVETAVMKPSAWPAAWREAFAVESRQTRPHV